MWACPKCATKLDPSFDVCWRCGTSKDGVEDPTFVKADDAAPIEGEPSAGAFPDVGGEAGHFDDSPGVEIVECYQALSLMEAKFIADQLVGQGIAAISDQADMQDSLGTWSGNPHVYVRSVDLPRARAWIDEYETKRQEHGHHTES